ncbi:porin [Pseudomonas aeruginosa]|nr:porin [Pseudomonas aeruginosa]
MRLSRPGGQRGGYPDPPAHGHARRLHQWRQRCRQQWQPRSVRRQFGSRGLWKDDSVWGLEGAWALGAFSAQAEYLRRTVKAERDREDLKASGYYAQLAYTLTGEPRLYKLDGAKFDTIKPENKEIGAWELFYRYDSIKVEDDNIVVDSATREVGDAKGKTHTLGVNWYANEAVKVSANYVKAKTDKISNANGDDSGDGLVMRLQYVF